MSVKVLIPTPLQKYTNNQATLECTETKTIADLIDNLEQSFPGFKERLYDEKGELRRFINFYVNEEDIRFLQNTDTSLKDGDVVSIVPAVAGG